jgi:hypothetical protein
MNKSQIIIEILRKPKKFICNIKIKLKSSLKLTKKKINKN